MNKKNSQVQGKEKIKENLVFVPPFYFSHCFLTTPLPLPLLFTPLFLLLSLVIKRIFPVIASAIPIVAPATPSTIIPAPSFHLPCSHKLSMLLPSA